MHLSNILVLFMEFLLLYIAITWVHLDTVVTYRLHRKLLVLFLSIKPLQVLKIEPLE